MGQFSTDPGSGRPVSSDVSPTTPAWPAGNPSGEVVPGWSTPPTQVAPPPPSMPGWPGQPLATGAPPQGPGWVANARGAFPAFGLSAETVGGGPNWTALRLIASWFKILAWIQGVSLALMALILGISIGAAQGNFFLGFILVIVLLVLAAIAFILIYSYAEIIMLFLTIEKNTRAK